MTISHFAQDAAQIALEKFNRGEIDRRSFLFALSGLGLAAAFKPGAALADASEIVVCNWGGAAVDAFAKAYGDPFTKKSGMKVVIDGAGPAIGTIRAMVESGKVIWDATDGGMIDVADAGQGQSGREDRLHDRRQVAGAGEFRRRVRRLELCLFERARL